jgi:superfamily II DNA or RNA helicase
MTEIGHFRELKQIIEYVYTKLESIDIKKIRKDEEDEAMGKEKVTFKKTVETLIKEKGNFKNDERHENKKIKKALKKRGVNVNLDDIETIDPLSLFGDEANLIDNFNFNDENFVMGENLEKSKKKKNSKKTENKEIKENSKINKKSKNEIFVEKENSDEDGDENEFDINEEMEIDDNMEVEEENEIEEDLEGDEGLDEEFDEAMEIDEENDDEEHELNQTKENEEEIDADEVEDEEEIEENDEEEPIEEEVDTNLLDHNKIKRLKREEDKIQKEIIPKHQIHLRTILCSATIEQLYQKAEKEKKGKKGKFNKNQKNKHNTDYDNENENEANKKSLENLVKNVRFYNKLIYVRNKTDFGSSNNTSEGNSTLDGSESNYYNDSYNEYYNNEEDEKKSRLLPEKLDLDCYKCESLIKDYYLLHILKENEGKTIIIFTNSISHTKKIYSIFGFFDFKLTVLHSKMQQSQRIKNLDKFRKKESNILFCTDIGARGLDIPLVDIVIHYHIPKTTELFIHRSGRTARALKSGQGISLISESELAMYKKIMKDLKIKEFGMKTLNVMQLEKYKSLFEYTKKMEKEDHSVKKKNREKQWFEKTANDCDMILDEEFSDDDQERKEKEKFLNRKRKSMQKEGFSNKKVFHNIIADNIKRTSFLTPELVAKLNVIARNKSTSDLNLTQAIFEANKDMQSFKGKGKEQKKRYQRRRKK